MTMKTFETEKGNIPEGATHYRDECDEYNFLWLRSVNNDWGYYSKLYGSFRKADNWVGERLGTGEINEIPWPTTETPEEKEALGAIEQVEWNGEGLPPVGCKIKTKRGISEVLSTSDWDGGVVTYSYKHEDGGMSIECAWNNESWINPIETPEAKKEREDLELINEVSEMLNAKGFCHDKLLLKCLISHKYLYRKGE